MAASVVDTESLYYLYKPNGDVIRLDLPRKTKQNHLNDNYGTMVVKYISPGVKFVNRIRKSRAISTTFVHNDEDVVRKAELSMKGNEFMIGPLLEEDHGNWVLSVYFKDVDDKWIELFQVITLEIVGKTKSVVGIKVGRILFTTIFREYSLHVDN